VKKEIVTEVIERAMAGDAEALDELYRTFAKTIIFNVYNMINDKENAEDVAQEIAIAVVKGIGKLQSPYAFTSWLHRMIINLCSVHNKRLKNKQGLDVAFDDTTKEIADANAENVPHQVVEQKQVKDLVLAAIQQLPPAQRSSIVMYYYDEMSYKEIAAALGVTINTASTNIRKAKLNLERILGEQNNGKGLTNLGAAVPIAGLDSLIFESLQRGADEVARDSVVDSFCKNAGISARQYLASSTPKATYKVGSLVKVFVALCAVGLAITIGIAVYSLNDAPPTNDVVIGSADNQATIVVAAFKPKAEIAMENQTGASNVNPNSANLVMEDTDGIEMVWSIINESDAEVERGDGDIIPAEAFANLAVGEYELTYTLINQKDQKANVSRTFFVF
jgi:RNA polymerase sigma-70 factor (ECF subfamily)